ncbi:RecB family exonuclease [Corynebacterium choanae]|uniref:ATP-dependent helicase/deoxyribonuclease subunit B n=1 Tax=Corynebacterium choanae TaxID=1862358 RepID=A0A3G6J6X0_9CORY|nr:PD-(D/E)XK nuclease family protein [Corynebacterium choanae]AZA13572.1 ATP-dependent helicase/deoxyribonuclease subunit B [Corynebacterium choanae]
MEQLSRKPSRPVALSPSAMATFHRCPLKFRLYRLDGYQEPATLAQLVGTTVHHVLEALLTPAPQQRSFHDIPTLLTAAEQAIAGGNDQQAILLQSLQDSGREAYRQQCLEHLRNYYNTEQPQTFTFTSSTEVRVSGMLAEQVPIVGFIDRVDILPQQTLVRIVDYKTGKQPAVARFREDALRQLRFYALAYWRQTGILPDTLTLMYLRERPRSHGSNLLTEHPTESQLCCEEEQIATVWSQILHAGEHGDFPARENALCKNYCAFHSMCPVFGGTTPDYPGWPGTVAAVPSPLPTPEQS